jgi:hypothetical protein
LGTLALTDRPEILGSVGLFGLDHLGPVGLPVLLVGILVATAALPLLLGYAVFRTTAIT